MSTAIPTAKVKLLVVVAPFELLDHLSGDFKRLGVHGFSTTRVNGTGAHGPRSYGIFDGANIRFEIIGTAQLAHSVMRLVATEFADRGVVAYCLDVEAVPFDHFG